MHSYPSSRSAPGAGLVFEGNGARPWPAAVAGSGSWQIPSAPLGAQGQRGDAWCRVFTTDWFAYLAPCCFARRPKRSPRWPQTASQAPPRENFPFVKGDFPCWAWWCVQKNFVGSSESDNSKWPVSPCGTLECPAAVTSSCPSHQGHTCAYQTGCPCPSWTVPFVPFLKIKSFPPLLGALMQIGTTFPENSGTGYIRSLNVRTFDPGFSFLGISSQGNQGEI
uniref:Uncharacterized protein n=1 Tax=Molossus molossus TaxID=27622 RepID=A0A7J8BYJ5_MOLMO|nr:hypothetical protein HJG59_010063 [Molossus molossus]